MAGKSNQPPGVAASSSASSPAGTIVSSGTVYNTCLAKFHDTDLCRFAATESAQPLTKTSYQATMTSTQSGTTTTLVFQQNGKGDTAIATNGGSSASPGLNSITYKGNTYIEDGSAWIKYPAASTPAQSANPSSSLSFMSSLVSKNLTKADSEACGSMTCLKYQLVDSATPNTTAYLWFDTQHYLLREWSSSDPTNGSIDMKISYQPVSISAPSPVENLSAVQ
jgi:hypothetical protein